ncbi:MAG: VPLPA-CTERM sorting domain-containing protein [Gammaproteobacteria bacterium]|nr:VPLPA-CTERM sorting domain-containing protein [Gammaproteobacteria bacterium]
MYKNLVSIFAVAVAMFGFTQESLAHIGWSNQDAIWHAASTTDHGDGSTTYHWQRGTVRTNWGWADATDADWGDSHQMKHVKFEITNPGGALVDITVKEGAVNFIPHGSTEPADAQLGLNPAFSLYRGISPANHAEFDSSLGVAGANNNNAHSLYPHAVHDWHPSFTFADAGHLGKEGLISAHPNADNGFRNQITMCNNGGQCGTQEYITHVGEINHTANEVNLAGLFLTPGWYAIAVGGAADTGIPYFENAHIGFPNLGPIITADSFGFHVDLTVRPVPVPAAVWLMGSALIGLAGFRKRRSAV